MRDFGGRKERIEPRFDGASGTIERGSSSFESSTDIHDVLMSASPRSKRSESSERTQNIDAQSNVQKQIESASQHKEATRASPRRQLRPTPTGRVQRRNGGRARSKPTLGREFSLSFGWFKPAHFALLILCSVLAGLYWAAEPINQFLERPFKSVVVEGDFTHVTKQRATELISEEIDNNFLKLDLMRIKHVLTNDPWVDSVTLQRRWPDTLVVKIKEQKPIARWGEGFLNQRGEIVKVADSSVLTSLPWLQGSEENAAEILQQYLAISQVLRTRGLDVIALKCDDKKAWRLSLNNNVELVLGRGQLLQKIDRFVDVYNSQLNEVWGDIVSIDARYSNGIAVRWLEGSESAQRLVKSESKRGA